MFDVTSCYIESYSKLIERPYEDTLFTSFYNEIKHEQ
jgi:hypothetical protein